VTLTGLGLLALSLLIWFAGPLLAFAGHVPLESSRARWVTIALLLVASLLTVACRNLRARARNASLLRSLFGQPQASAEAPEVQLLRQRFEQALKVLRESQLGQSGKGLSRLLALGQKRQLYQLPWYVFIGAPGSGKTTALIHSGLRFPLAHQLGQHQIQGIGGTRNCDWWFSDEAVLLDTAGRYTTQDSEQDSDRQAWLGFLDLLRRHRPQQPLNGVLLTVSIADLLGQSESDAARHALALRTRLQELYSRLDMRLPVYVLVTKSDLIAGFDECFASLNQSEREQVWGCTLPLAGAQQPDPLQTLGPQLDALRQRLQEQQLARLQAEPDLQRRGAIAGFDQQFSATCRSLQAFLAQVFAPSGYDHELMVRGVYFTSGTQEGSPIDRLMSSLGAAFGLERRLLPPLPGSGRSYFLNRLLRELVFAEQQLGSRRLAWQRRRELARVGLLAATGLASLALLAGWTLSYTRNSHYLEQVDQAVAAVQPMVSGLEATPAPGLDALLPVLQTVTSISATPGRAPGEQPAGMGLGLFQGDKLDAAARQADLALLREWLLPLIAVRLEQQLRGLDGSDLEFAYEALKAYRMLHEPAHFDAAAFKAWILLDWERQQARGLNMPWRAALEQQLDLLFGSGPVLPPMSQDLALVERTRALLMRFSPPQRVYSRLRREGVGSEFPAFSIERAAGPSAALVFVRRSGKPLGEALPGLYTHDGYHRGFAREVDRISRQLAAEEGWVLGQDGSPTPIQAAAVAAQARRLYLADYARLWEELLADLALRPFARLEQSVQAARILSGPDSPLPGLLAAIVHETTLTPAQPSKDLSDKAGEKLAGAREQLGRLFGSEATVAPAADAVPERLVDDRFAGLRQLVAGDPKSAPINEVLKLLDQLYVELSATETAIRDKVSPPAGDAAARIKAESARLPEPLRSLLQQLSASGTGQVLAATRQTLSAAVGSQVGQFCSLAIAGRYPFDRSSSRDATREDFARLFGPGGLMDVFFQQQLAPHVDTTTRPWSFRKVQQQSFGSPGNLAQFERAAAIREVFFRSATLRFDFKLLEADTALTPLTLDIDGQPLQFSPAQTGPQSAQWPGPRGGLTAQLKLGNAGLLAAEGPWALFRLVDRARIETLGTPEKLRATFEAGGRRASFEITSASVLNPLRLRELAEFHCPQGL
ncbi:MAG: type secretion system rane subunit TssM, partial [Pseudomonadota bacterium]